MKEENKKDIVVKIRERQMENEVVATLRTEALEQFATQKKPGIFAKLFRSSQIELEKERFINQYLVENNRIRKNDESGLKELLKSNTGK